MAITDLFSHKIHSSGDEWPEKLAELAAIFAEFDGRTYNRDVFEARLQLISPRVSYLAAAGTPLTATTRRDASKFRDEISAYPAYLGLYFLQPSPAGWVVRLSETAKRFLVREDPDVASFLRLQLPLLQYPMAMGARYLTGTNKLTLQANTAQRTREFIRSGIHLSPVRLIAVALQADARVRDVDVLDSSVSYDEIFGLANTTPINQRALPSPLRVARVLDEIRNGNSSAIPARYESRFHILRHTELFVPENGVVKLRKGVNAVDRLQIAQQLNAICRIQNQFSGFDNCSSRQEIEAIIARGQWGEYFDGVRVLPSDIVEVLTNDQALESTMPLEPEEAGEAPIIPEPIAVRYPFRDRTGSPPPVPRFDRRHDLADPELTRIKRQRRNLLHKELVDKMDAWLRRRGANPKDNDHIDLFAKIPDDGSFIFEMKSGGESILEQIRKGLSQLYEYRYRYRSVIEDEDISLCLVLPEPPASIPWAEDYLCKDREINICWFEEGDKLAWSELCAGEMAVLMPTQ